MTPKPTLYIVVNNHFDPTWRRCWQKPFSFHGQTFVSYSELQADYMLDNIDLALHYPEYKFVNAQAVQLFGLTQPALIEWVSITCPSLFCSR